MRIKIAATLILAFSLLSLDDLPKKTTNMKDMEITNQFELAVNLIKKHEGIHNDKEYVGYGHRITKNDKFKRPITESQADSLLRSDLRAKMTCFKRFGKDSLILGVLAYNVGEGVVLGSKTRSKSKLIKSIESGNMDVYNEYISFSKWNGKVIRSIKQRRITEFNQLSHGFKRRATNSNPKPFSKH